MSNVRPLRDGVAPAQQASAGSVVNYVKTHRGALALVVVAVLGLYLWHRFGTREANEGAADE